MKRLATVFLVFLFFVSAQAQEKPILEFEKPTKYKIQKIESHADVDGNVLYLIFSSYKCHMKYFDKEMNLQNEFAFKKDFTDEMPSFIGSSKKDNMVTFFTQKESEWKNSSTIDVKAWEIDIKDLSKTKLNQKVLTLEFVNLISIHEKNDNYFFTYYSPHESDTIKFVSLSDPKTSIKQFKLNEINHDEVFNEKLWLYVDTDEFTGVKNQTSSKKFYHKEGLLYFVNDKNNYSDLMKMDLSTSEVTINKLESKKINLGKNGVQKISSFLLDDMLFQFHASTEEGILNVFDITKLQLIKSFSFYKKNDNISLSNTFTILTNFSFTPPAKEIVEKTKVFLKKISKSDAVINVSLDVNNNYIVELGGIDTYAYNYYHDPFMFHHMMDFPISIPASSIPSFHGPNFDDDHYFNLYPQVTDPILSKLITFKALLDGTTLDHLPGNIVGLKHIDFDKLLDQHSTSLKDKKVKFSTYKKYKYKDHYHKIGYNKKNKTIQVYEIKPKETSK